MNGQAIANNVAITKGGLQHAEVYATSGGVTVNAEADSGDIDLGGLSGDKVGGNGHYRPDGKFDADGE